MVTEVYRHFERTLEYWIRRIAQLNRHRFDGTYVTTVQPSKTTVVHSQITALHSRHIASACNLLVPGVAVSLERYTVGGFDTK